ncbi:MAG: hypothetical protein ACOCP8_05550 [archaeon]
MDKLFYYKDFNYYFNKIKNDHHFKYSRFNDGELIAIGGSSPNSSNCDGHKYFPEMGVELKNILLNYEYSDDYVLESFDHWYNKLSNIRKILNNLKDKNKNLSFLSYDFIRITHEQNPKNFINLLNVLKEKNVVIVGPEYLHELNNFFNFRYIDVPIKNCYLEKDNIINNMNNITDKEENVYFLLSASMPANIIIDNFKNDNNNTFIDWGSVWDTFFVSSKFGFIKKRSTSNNNNILEKYKDYLI